VRRFTLCSLLLAFTLLAGACAGGTEGPQASPDASPSPDDTAEESDEPADADAPLTVYTGRSLELVGPLLEQFQEETGIVLQIRSGDTAELAATILEEGDNSPADVYFGQDAGALGSLAKAGRLAPLPDELLERVDPRFRAADGTWVGTSGRARVIVYSTELVAEEEVPDSVLDLTDPRWSGRVGWAPTNGSFQAFVTAMRLELGDDATREWLEGMVANDVQTYANNAAQVEAAGRGEIEVGLVNHYYLYRFLDEDPNYPAANKFLTSGDAGALVNVAGVGILETSDHQDRAAQLVDFLLSEEAQTYFADETNEYPLVTGVAARDELPPLAEIDTPDIDLGDLDDLEGTLRMLRETGALD
jgi:iron(III) transport system substrate-binding protein